MGNAKNASKDVSRAGQVASVAESRRKPGPDPVDRRAAADMRKINRHVEKQTK
jgi:hypothetical protein